MHFANFNTKIPLLKTAKLGGQPSQFKLVPKLRTKFSEEKIKQSNPREAGVLALFYPDENKQTRFLLTQRASYNGTHSAQISFVGGKKEKNETLEETAKRETFEEVGISLKNIQIIRELSQTYIPPSNFLVTPFLGYTKEKPIFKPNEEVKEIIEVNVLDLLNKKNLSSVVMKTSYMKQIKVPCFKLNGHIVWGATAMMLSEIKDLLNDVF